MFLKTVWAVVLLVFNATVCNALTIPPSESSLISTSAPLINTFSPRDTNLATSSNDILVECSESRYGSGLRYASCLDAFSTFHEGGTTNPVRVGRRGTGHDYAQSLPWRWVSGDGRCTFDITKSGRAPFETTTGQQVARTAWKLLNQCVRDQRGVGGVVSGIGQKSTLAITVRPYNPSNVQCGSAPQQYEENKCEPLLDSIPADIAPVRTWGPRNQPGVDIPLPYSWAAQPPHENCRIYVFGTSLERPARDTMSFYDIWEAGTMVQGMCARFGRPGLVSGLGARKLIWVAMSDGSTTPYMNGVDGAAATNETVLTLDGSSMIGGPGRRHEEWGPWRQ